MVIGTGDLGKIIQDREGFTFFACGESNRFPLTIERKAKEMTRLLQVPKDTMLVYFSTLSIYYADNEYTRHKAYMERLVRERFDNYCILRLGTITWGDNPNTFYNFVNAKLSAMEDVDVWDATRYFIDEDELKHWIGMIPPDGKHEMNITGQRLTVKQYIQRHND